MMNFRDMAKGYFSRHDRSWILSLVAAVCLVYLPFLGNPFIFDDVRFFQSGSVNNFASGEFHYGLRWLPYATLGWTYALFSDVLPHFYHFGNLLVHAASVIALFYLLRQLVTAVIPDSTSAPSVIWGAWFGALLFAVHPVAVYGVGYLIQRSILMATLFVLLMQLAYLRGLLSGRWGWLALAVAAYFLAGFSKEHSVLAPALLGAETLLLRAQIRASARALWLTWGALALVGMQIVLLAKGVIGTPYEGIAEALFEQQDLIVSTPVLHVLSVLTQAGLFFKYLLLMLVPNPAWMSVDMREPFVSSLAAWQGWLGATGFILYGVLGLWLLLRPRWAGLAGLALLYPWLLFALEFSSIRVQEIFVLYRSYLWLPGIMLFIPMLLAKWPGKKMSLTLAMAALLLLPLAWNRLWVFGDNYRLWNDAAKLLQSGKEPMASRIYYNRANAQAGLGKWEEAATDYERAVAGMQREYTALYHALGVAYLNTRRYQEALAQFDKVIALDPDFATAYYNKGVTLKRLQQHDLAMQNIAKSCELKYSIACLILNMNLLKK
ncbi:MAG TPA: tetratricopeptide repeat protein [Gallionellaceae bacterium]|nr:tetratricopeptide repeat protein [Gallionellaceae bacterium]